MTYVVAVKHYGQVAILADMGVSFYGQRIVDDTGLKTGILCTGCVYGIAGAAEPARWCLEAARAVCRPAATLSENWSSVVEVLRSRPAARGHDQFQLLFSSRASGQPEIFGYDSSTTLVTLHEDFVTIGKGAEVLDDRLASARGSLLIPSTPLLVGWSALDEWPSLYCLWLSQHTLSQDYDLRASLRAAGVGGLFHFVVQGMDHEKRQPPSVLLLTDYSRDANRVVTEFYKIACAKDVVVVDNPTTDSIRACWDIHSGPDPRLMYAADLKREVLEVLSSEACFCGFGFLNPELFDRMFFHVARDGAAIVSMQTATLHENALRMIERAIGLPHGVLTQPVIDSTALEEHRAQRQNLKDV